MGMEVNYERDSKERIPFEHYLEAFRQADPEEIAVRCALPYDPENKTFQVCLLGVNYTIVWPSYEIIHEEGDQRDTIRWRQRQTRGSFFCVT